MASVSTRIRAFTRGRIQFKTEDVIRAGEELQIEAAQKMKRELQIYPPELPNQKYVRTFKLQEHWKIVGPNRTPNQLITYVENDVKDTRGRYYAQYVQGRFQTYIHQGRWMQAETAVGEPGDETVLEIRREYISGLRRAVRNSIRYV